MTMTRVKEATIETITPDLAREWLAKNIKNRPLMLKVVRSYEGDMRQGLWRLTGDTIKFDVNGRLIDGQHRLQACVRAGKSFRSYVARGLPTDAYVAVDIGAKRSAGDMLSYAGFGQKPKQLATAFSYALTIPSIEEGKVLPSALGRTKIPIPRILGETKKYHEDMLICLDTVNKLGGAPFSPPTLFAALYFMFKTQYPRETAQFFDQLRLIGQSEGGPDIEVSNPVRALFRSLCSIHADGRVRARICYPAALTIKAFNAFVNKGDMAIVRWAEREMWPRIPRKS